jgi:hypothetical protein
MTELLARKALLNAMALNTVGMGLMGVFFSSAGGLLVEKVGPDVVYMLVALLLGGTAWMFAQLPHSKPRGRENNSMASGMIGGGRYILRKPELLWMMALELGRVMLYRPYMTLLPIFAADVFDTGAIGLGILRSASAVGGLLSSLIIASLGGDPP